DGLGPREQLAQITLTSRELVSEQARCFVEDVCPALAEEGIRVLLWRDLSAAQQVPLHEYFASHVFPVLTPLAVDPGHPFPYISNLSLSLAVELRDPETSEDHFARVKVPTSLPRWVPVSGRANHFVPLEEVIGANLGALFPGMEVLRWHPFRITRYSDLELPVEEP